MKNRILLLISAFVFIQSTSVGIAQANPSKNEAKKTATKAENLLGSNKDDLSIVFGINGDRSFVMSKLNSKNQITYALVSVTRGKVEHFQVLPKKVYDDLNSRLVKIGNFLDKQKMTGQAGCLRFVEVKPLSKETSSAKCLDQVESESRQKIEAWLDDAHLFSGGVIPKK